MKYPAYKNYKASGVQWLGEVPGHWEVKAIKYAFPRLHSGVSVNAENTPADMESCGVMKTSCVYGNRFHPTENKRILDDELDRASCPVTEDSLIISRMNTPELVGNCGYVSSNYPNLFLPDRLWIARFNNHKEMIGKFSWYLISSDPFVELTGALATGTSGSMKNLSQDAFLNITASIPPIPEQTTIANFLDRETGRIDRLVTKKQRLIELLKEQRSALISRTVTRGLPADIAHEFGLPPHTRFKDSGVEWLGEVPEGWEVKKLGHLSIIVRGGSPRPAGDPRYFDGDYIPWITVGEVTKDTNVYLETTESMLTEEGATCSRTIKSGTLVITNSGATLGVPKILKITGCANDGIVAFESLSDKADIYFLYYFLSSLTHDLRNRLKQGGGQPNLNTDLIKAIFTPFPDKAEQIAIATYLDRETQKIDRLLAKVEAAIQRLQEYRTALITAAVTGKIDVRGVAA